MWQTKPKFFKYILFFLASSLFANPDISYREELDQRMVQKLEWQKNEAVYNFLVEIQKEEDNQWKESVNEVTADNFIEISLSRGQYRYRITPSDLLGRRRAPAEWSKLEVIPIFKPELNAFSPEVFYLDEAASENYALQIKGENLLKDSLVFLRSSKGENLQSRAFRPSEDGKTAELVYDKNKLSEGFFDVIVENPGGLKAELRNFRIIYGNKSRKAVDNAIKDGTVLESAPQRVKKFYLSEGYAPFFALPSVFNDFFKKSFFEAGVFARLGWLPLRVSRFYFGPEIEATYHYLSAPRSENDSEYFRVYSHYFSIKGGAVTSISIVPRFSINFRAGAGATVLRDIHIQSGAFASGQSDAWILFVSGGTSFSYFVFNDFSIDAGLDFQYLFARDKPQPSYFMPSIGMGFKF